MPMPAMVNTGSDEDAARATALLRAAARADFRADARLAAAVDDLFLAEEMRPDEGRRRAMAALLRQLVASVEDDLRERLVARLGGVAGEEVLAALATARVAIAAPILEDAGVLRDPQLVAVLAARVGEYRLAELLRQRGGLGEREAVGRPAAWIDSADATVAEATTALLIAESRRIDPLHRPLIGGTDLPADLHHRLTWRIAAALRRWLVAIQSVPAPEADPAIADAVTASLALHDEGRTLEAAALRLARVLTDDPAADLDAVLLRALDDGRPALLAGLIALRAAVPFDVARQALLEPDGARLTVLLRAGGVGRAAAIELLHAIGEAHGRSPADPTGFDLIDEHQVRAVVMPWRSDPAYRAAIVELERLLR